MIFVGSCNNCVYWYSVKSYVSERMFTGTQWNLTYQRECQSQRLRWEHPQKTWTWPGIFWTGPHRQCSTSKKRIFYSKIHRCYWLHDYDITCCWAKFCKDSLQASHEAHEPISWYQSTFLGMLSNYLRNICQSTKLYLKFRSQTQSGKCFCQCPMRDRERETYREREREREKERERERERII